MSDGSRRENGGRPTQNPVSSTISTITTHGPTVTTTYTTAGPQTTVTTSGPRSTTIVSPTVTTTHRLSLPQPPPPPSAPSQAERQPSIRIRRAGAEQTTHSREDDGETPGNRRRSFSEPERPQPALLQEVDDLEIRRHVSATPLQTLQEEGPAYSVPQFGYYTPAVPEKSPRRPAYARQTSAISLRHSRNLPAGEYEADVVDVLDVIGIHMFNLLANSADLPCRSRGCNAHDPEQRPELALHPELWSFLRSPPHLRALAIRLHER